MDAQGKDREFENADIICERIRREAQEEIARIIDRASQEAAQVMREASSKADKKRGEKKTNIAAEIGRERERVLSAVSLEKKRLALEEKNAFVNQILKEVTAQACRYREREEYASFLEKAVLQGVRVVDEKNVVVQFSPQDQALAANRDFRERCSSQARTSGGAAVDISWVRGDFADPGAVVSTPDGRIRFDNRFGARMERMREAIVAELIREAW